MNRKIMRPRKGLNPLIFGIAMLLIVSMVACSHSSQQVSSASQQEPSNNQQEPSVSQIGPSKGYQRECENPDESTVGQTIARSNASGGFVHGQFGVKNADPWPAQAGEVVYKKISMPKVDQLYLKLRYSKNSPSSVPILVFLDDETSPRATISPADQGDWNTFAWTESIPLGSVESGMHSIKFSTAGQQYGVADLDKFILATGTP